MSIQAINLLRNHQFLTGADRVRIPQDTAIRVEYLRVLSSVTIELAADFRKSISSLNGIAPLVLATGNRRPRSHGSRGLLCCRLPFRNPEIADQIGKRGIDQFDLVPDSVLNLRRLGDTA